MPFVSKKQQKKCYAMKGKGSAGSWDCDEWSEDTNFQKIPEKKSQFLDPALLHGARYAVTKYGAAKKESIPDDLGGYSGDRASLAVGLDDAVNAMEHNRHHHPWNYWLNPAVRGPITEFLTRMDRRSNTAEALNPWLSGVGPVGDTAAGLGAVSLPEPFNYHNMQYGLGVALGDKDKTDTLRKLLPKHHKGYDEETKDKEELKKKAEKLGPYDRDRAADLLGTDKVIANMVKNRTEHPYHYWLNPFVGGPLSEVLTRGMRRNVATSGTSTPMAIANNIPGVNLASIPVSMFMGGAERRQKLRERYKDTLKEDKKDDKEKKSSSIIEFGKHAGYYSATNRTR